MLLNKLVKDLKIAVLLPAYRRAEYTRKCIAGLIAAQEYKNTVFYLMDDGSMDDTAHVLLGCKLPKTTMISPTNEGLRSCILTFFDFCLRNDIDILAKIDNDCVVPRDWLNHIVHVFETTDADILSPNVFPSNAAYQYGSDEEGRGYRPAEIVGGLWVMKREMIEDMDFEKHSGVNRRDFDIKANSH
jgi:glycosyltransferase involved in cell wall biosynthesis